MPAIKEIPIIFNTDMVRAILEGRKTQTRRVIKPQPIGGGEFVYNTEDHYWYFGIGGRFNLPRINFTQGKWKCPYGIPGDRLWIKEKHYIEKHSNCAIMEDGTEVFRTGEIIPNFCNTEGLKWRPARFMPRWATRLFLEITNIRVERLQDITEENALAEGIEILQRPDGTKGYSAPNHGYWEYTAKAAFMYLWDSINAKPKPVKVKGVITHYESYPWEGKREIREHRGKLWYVYPNPWIWVIEFKRI